MRSDLTFLSYIVYGYSFFVDTVYILWYNLTARVHYFAINIINQCSPGVTTGYDYALNILGSWRSCFYFSNYNFRRLAV